MADINIGSIYADLDIRTGNLDRGIARAREALKACDREAVQLNEDLKQGGITATDHASRMAALAATVSGLTTRMEAAYGATRTLNTGLEILNKKANGMVGATSRMGQGLMQLGYIADDIQYGFSGIVNNIAPLAYGLGGSAGLAAGLQITAVAAHQLYVHLDDLKDALGVSGVRTEAEEMERLAKATSRTAEETEKLNRYKEKQSEIAQMMGGQSQQTGEVAKAVQDVFSETGVDRVSGALAAKMMAPITPEQQAEIDAAQAKVDAAKAGVGESVEMVGLDGNSYSMKLPADPASAEEKLEKVRGKIQKDRDKEAGDRAVELMRQALQAGPEGEQARQSIMTKFADPNDPLHNIVAQLQAAPPRAMDAMVNQFKQTERPKRAQEADQEDAKTLGRMAYLEKKVEEGRADPAEFRELEKLKEKDAKKKEKEKAAQERKDAASRQRAVGRKAFLEEKEKKEGLSWDEETELERLQSIDSAKVQREALREGVKAAPGGTKQIAETLAMDVMQGVIDPVAARKQIADRLKENGATDMEANFASGKFMGDAAKTVEEGFYKRALNAQHSATSRVFNANDLATEFQSSVGGTKNKELSVLEAMQKNLDKLIQQGEIRFIRTKR